MSERDELLADLRERARFYASLTEIGPRRTSDRPIGRACWPSARGGLQDEPPTEAGRGTPSDRPASPKDRAALSSGGPGAAPPLQPAGLPSPHGAPGASAAEALSALRATLGDCQRCKLAGGRKTIVFGQGNPEARLMFVGEAPGADEDEQGLAFVGRAGQLLTDIIEKGMKIRRADVFIANIIKCRPPGNRNPEPDEILSCQPFLDAQIDAIHPRVIVALGKFSAQWLLKTAEPITRLRGRVGAFRGITVMPTFHPAYLLRNPASKRDLWADMQVVMRLLAEG